MGDLSLVTNKRLANVANHPITRRVLWALRSLCLQVWQCVASNDVMLSWTEGSDWDLWLWSIGVMTVSTACLRSVPRNPSLSIIPSTPNDRQRSKSYNCLIVIVLRLGVMISCPGLLLRDWFLISWLQLLLSWVVKDDSVFIDLGVTQCFDWWDLFQKNLIFRI